MSRILVQSFLVNINAFCVMMSTPIHLKVLMILIVTAQLYNHHFLRRRVHHHHPSPKLPDHQSENIYSNCCSLLHICSDTFILFHSLMSHRCPTPRPMSMSLSPPHSSTSRTNYPSARPSVSQAYDPTHHPTIASL